MNRVRLLDVPIDGVKRSNALKVIEEHLNDDEGCQVVFLTIRKLLKAKYDPEMARCLRYAGLVLPVSKGLIRGARFQKKAPLFRYNPFEFTIRMLELAERLNRTVYLLGARKEEIEEAEINLKISFPKLRIVGRYSGYYDKALEKDIILGIRKASPSMLLVGKGVPNQDKWIARNRKHFNPGIYIWVGNCFEIFAGKERNVSKRTFYLGLESLPEIIRKPWQVFRLFPYLYFKLLVLIYRIRGL